MTAPFARGDRVRVRGIHKPGEYVVAGCYPGGVSGSEWTLYVPRLHTTVPITLFIHAAEGGLWETQGGDTVELATEPVVEPEEQGELGL